MSKDNKEWICKACQSTICHVTVPKLSIYNEMGIVQQPPELNLYAMEDLLLWEYLLCIFKICQMVGRNWFVEIL